MAKRIKKQTTELTGIATASGTALALYYLSLYDGETYSMDDLNRHAADYCNHKEKYSGKNLQAKFLEWKYMGVPGHPYFLTAKLSNMLMAKARVERFEEAIRVLRLKGSVRGLSQAGMDYKEFLANNPKLENYIETIVPKIKEKPYNDPADIFQVLQAIETRTRQFIPKPELDYLYGFIAGYEFLALETQTQIKNLEKFREFILFLGKSVNKGHPTTNWVHLLHAKYGPKRGFKKFFEYLGEFKKF